MIQYRVITYTNSTTNAVWYLLQVSNDGGATWTAVKTTDRTNWPFGIVASQTQSVVVTAMNTYHQTFVNDLSSSNWTAGPVVAGPV